MKMYKKNLCDLGLQGKNVLDLKPKAQPIKGQIDKLDSIKIKAFCPSKEYTIKVMKMHALCYDYILAMHLSDTGHIFRIHKESVRNQTSQ